MIFLLLKTIESNTPLSVGYRQGYSESAGVSDVRGSIQLFALALLVAFASALLPLIGLYFNVPLLLILSGLARGVTLGIGLRLIFRTLRLRNRRVSMLVLAVSSALAVAFLHVGFYLQAVQAVYRAMLMPGGGITSLSSISQPFSLYNQLVRLPVGKGGVAGYAILRLSNHTYSTSTIIHAVLTPFLACQISEGESSPFCESCACWTNKACNAAVVPSNMRDTLVEIVKSGDVGKAIAFARATADLPLGNSCALARYYQCPSCAARMIDVYQRGTRNRNNSAVLKAMPATHEFVDALRSDPVTSLVEDDPTTFLRMISTWTATEGGGNVTGLKLFRGEPV